MLLHTFMHPFMHAGMHSKSTTVIEGLETAPSSSPSPSVSPPQDVNIAEIVMMKNQIATLMQSAQLLKIQMLQTEAGVQQNEKNIQEVVKSQDDMRNKLADMKSSQ
jgi:uncharacterized protein (DUF2252 family)